MGNEGYHLKFKEYKNLMKPTLQINTLKDIAQERPNPMYHDTAKFYALNHLKIRPVTMTEVEKIGELSQCLKGKEEFFGDSMMIASNLKLRKNHSRLKSKGKSKKKTQQEHLIEEKSNINKEAMQETQLVKIEATDTLEGKIDIAKIKEIRLALRRRYASRTNFRKIYKEWDFVNKGEIMVYTAHTMINRLGIPINFNETRALIASSNKRNTETLDMEEFMHLIFNDNNALNLDLKKLRCK